MWESDPKAARHRLREQIEAEAGLALSRLGRARFSDVVLDAIEATPREEFVLAGDRSSAYANAPLPIGQGQTISQPLIVAVMTEMLDVRPEHTVLDVGSGSGYQAAVLARLVRFVYGIELIPELATRAANRVAELGYSNVEIRQGDGSRGRPEHAPYDGILVAAAASHVPPALVEQLRPGGKMAIPVGEAFGDQMLVRIEKTADGKAQRTAVLPVAFVPMKIE